MATARDPTTDYARKVTRGKILTNRFVRLACQRHIDDIKHQKRKGLDWDPDSADAALGFFPGLLRLAEGQFAGKPFVLEPFQQFIVGSIFGWYGADGFRRFRTAYVEIAKGSGKSPLAAGIGLYELVSGQEQGAQIFSAAVNHDQASIVFKDAYAMVSMSPDLRSDVTQNVGNLSVLATGSFFRAVSSEHRGLDGKRVHVALIDEIHEHRTALVVDKMRAGTKARRNAIIFEITNSGFDRNTVCWEHHEYSRKVLEGVLDNDAWFAFVCGLDDCDKCRRAGKRAPGCKKCDDWKDERVWPKANPGLGTILPFKYVREQVAEAIGMPSKQNIVRRLNFCEWTERKDRLIDIDLWDQGKVPVDEKALVGKRAFGGLDLALVNDLSALVLVFPADDRVRLLARFWCPEDDITERSLRDGVPYDIWRGKGLIEMTPGNVTDFGFIAREILQLAAKYDIIEIAYDRTFAGKLVQELTDEGITMVPFGQGFLSMGPAVAELLRLVKGEGIDHGGHEILRWNISNAQALSDAAGNLKIDKSDVKERVDGAVALAMAVGRSYAYHEGAGDGPSVLETRGPLVVRAE